VSSLRVGPLTLALLLTLTLGAATASADRLHLENGGFIDVGRWWIDDDWLHYESAGGSMGLPRSAVVRIETRERETEQEPPRVAPAPTIVESKPTAVLQQLQRRLGEAGRALKQREYEIAASDYLRVLSELPELVSARVGYAVSKIALGHDGMALSVVLDGLALDADQPELLELLGDLRSRDERLDEALRAWNRAFEQAPNDRLREKILKGERERQAADGFDFAASSHFNLRFDGDVDQQLAGEVRDYLEEQYWTLTDRFSHSPTQPITVLLYATRQFRDVTQTPEWVGGLYDGKIRVPLGGLRRLHPPARSVLRHELTHAVVHSKTRGNCPRWLHEGLAQISEGKQIGPREQQAVDAFVRGGDLSSWPAATLAYPIALSQARYLESRGGTANLTYLLGQLSRGDDIDTALRHVYGQDHAAILRDWAQAQQREQSR